VLHELSANDKLQRVSACVSLLSRHQKSSFLERIVTGDQKWVLYINIGRKKQWLNPAQKPLPDVKADLHPKKVLLCIWWDLKGVLYYELLYNATITAEVYAHQLQRVQEALLEKRPTLINGKGVILLHDNVWPHVAKITREKIQKLGWEFLPHPPFSPDLAPSDYHLFCSLRNHLAEKRFEDYDTLNSDLAAFFDSKEPDFYKNRIYQLPKRWATVIDNNGEYIID
jgi:histone-lysine N-methyltransferase SETMAR